MNPRAVQRSLGRPGAWSEVLERRRRALPLEGFDRLEASAIDGFVAQIPLTLIEVGKSGCSVTWIAVEDPNHPWPKLPGKDASAGPFYLVWQYPERSRVSSPDFSNGVGASGP